MAKSISAWTLCNANTRIVCIQCKDRWESQQRWLLLQRRSWRAPRQQPRPNRAHDPVRTPPQSKRYMGPPVAAVAAAWSRSNSSRSSWGLQCVECAAKVVALVLLVHHIHCSPRRLRDRPEPRVLGEEGVEVVEGGHCGEGVAVLPRADRTTDRRPLLRRRLQVSHATPPFRSSRVARRRRRVVRNACRPRPGRTRGRRPQRRAWGRR